MTAEQTAAADRIAAAIKGKIPTAVGEVLAADVAAVAAAAPVPGDPKVAATVAALLKGSTAALKGLNPERAAERTIHVTVSDLAAVLGANGVNPQ